MKKELSQGAEASIYLEGGKIFKVRHSKAYRLPQIDSSLISSRTKREKKIIQKLTQLNILVPKLYSSTDDATIVMEFIDGERLRDTLLSSPKKIVYIKQLAKIVAKIHDAGIIHGDLTTSNILKPNISDELVLIDFGLSFFSDKLEDKAVDIHLLFRSFESTHYQEAEFYESIFQEAYISFSGNGKETLLRLEDVQKRGKNKH
jgi:Kae1-associated kinase Bud32